MNAMNKEIKEKQFPKAWGEAKALRKFVVEPYEEAIKTLKAAIINPKVAKLPYRLGDPFSRPSVFRNPWRR